MKEPEPLKPPQQERSRETLLRIVSAARSLLAERDFANISVDDIVRRAASSKGSFYQRFSNKDSLLVLILRQEHDAAIREWSEFLAPERWRHRSLEAVVEAFLDRLLRIYRRRPTLMRAYAAQAAVVEGEIRGQTAQLNRHVLELLRQIVRQHAGELKHPDPERATAFLITALITLLPPLFLSPTQELLPEPMSHAELENELRLLARRYLGLRDAKP